MAPPERPELAPEIEPGILILEQAPLEQKAQSEAGDLVRITGVGAGIVADSAQGRDGALAG